MSKKFRRHIIYRVVVTMNKIIFKFSSVTYALKGKEIAESLGGKAVVRKNPHPSKKEGCGYSLTVNGNVDRIITAFDLNRVKFLSYEMM